MSSPSRIVAGMLSVVLPALHPAPSHAQDRGALTLDRSRIGEITGGRIDGVARPDTGVRWSIRLVRNSDIPFGGNDADLWAGRGLNFSVNAGYGRRWQVAKGTLTAELAPTFTVSENRPFQIRPTVATSTSATAPGRSPFSSPWHKGVSSIDLPMRPGDGAARSLSFGQSQLSYSRGPLDVGVSSREAWWGPGRRTALVMSNNAPGIPRLYARTATPFETRMGSFDAELVAGLLSESKYFDSVASNDSRSLSGLRLEWRVPSSHVALGAARAVYRPLSRRAGLPIRAADALWIWEDLVPTADTNEARLRQRADQLTSVFARWFDPASGLEVYGEWARMELPRTMGDLFLTTSHTLGYTLGLQYATTKRGGVLDLQVEMTNLEQSNVIPGRDPPSFYTSRASAQGYTNRGQVVGAWIGPGASSQWVATDFLRDGMQFGVFLGRIRWENDVMYSQPFSGRLSHDVTLYSGARASITMLGQTLASEIAVGRRQAYLFQKEVDDPRFPTVDIQNVTMSFSISGR